MNIKVKLLAIAVLGVLATSALVAMNAGATSGGHFEFDTEHTVIKGQDGVNAHNLHFVKHNGTEPIGCKTTYQGTTTKGKVTQFDLAPTYLSCTTTEGGAAVTIAANGCTYRFTVAPGGTNGTMDIVCPIGKSIEIHHPNCTIVIPQQENISGLHYTTTIDSVKHAITLDMDGTIATVRYHGGICIFLGTNQTARLKGSMTIWAEDKNGNRVNMTAT